MLACESAGPVTPVSAESVSAEAMSKKPVSAEPVVTEPVVTEPFDAVQALAPVVPERESPASDMPESERYPEQVITLMREGRVAALAERVRYPLKRPFPLSRLRQPADFVARYHQIFDEAFQAKIIASKPNQWSHYGWRGRAYEGLWVDEDEDIIQAIAHESSAEKADRLALVEQVRAVLHPSLQDFAAPLVYIETTKFKIWLDRTADGTRRYASWSRSKPLSAEPDLVLSGGALERVGRMNDEIHTFRNADATYQVFPSGDPKSGWPYIEVRQGDQLLLEQSARWVDLATVVADPMPGPLSFVPTGRETLQSFMEPSGSSALERMRSLLAPHGMVLLSHGHYDSLEGDDPVRPNAHPGEENTFIIGGCNVVEAYWILASFTRGTWFTPPDAASLQWSDAPDRPGATGLERASVDSPNVEQWDTLWSQSFTVSRRKDTGEIVAYRTASRGEGGGSETTMKKVDGYTWILREDGFAD